jgi:hypothetical protein
VDFQRRFFEQLTRRLNPELPQLAPQGPSDDRREGT